MRPNPRLTRLLRRLDARPDSGLRAALQRGRR